MQHFLIRLIGLRIVTKLQEKWCVIQSLGNPTQHWDLCHNCVDENNLPFNLGEQQETPSKEG